MSNLADPDANGVRHFPPGFLFATGTSAYQVEGGVGADGRLPSIWDTFVRTPGATVRGDTGDVACDSYNRIDDDVRMVSELGVGAYRFSISWSRVLPTGNGAVNQAGLDYYRRLSASLRDQGITPVATLYHWDLPQALEDRGGWASREAAERMGEFALLMGEALRDEVGMWITINEPLQVASLGYRVGAHAPGVRDLARAAAATHHIMLAHGLALQALRSVLPAGVPIGPTMDPQPYIPLDAESVATCTLLDAEINRVFMDPVFQGSYPADLRDEFRPPAELIKDGDMELISAPIDFFGVNYYRPHYVRRGDWADLRIGESPIGDHPGFVEYKSPELDKTIMDWLVVPEGLRDLLLRLHHESGGVKLYITENGCASEDYVNPAGTVDDYDRVSYIHGHLSATLDAIDDGVDVAGYFHWSLMDNFEWAFGYARRFGLYYVDFETGRRLPKRSAHYYGEIARTGVLPAALSSADLAAV
jgi:beta-glucosidase